MKRNIMLALLLLTAKVGMSQSYTLTLVSKPGNSSFRYINNSPTDAGSNYAGTGMVIADWTSGGIPYNWRVLLKFDLSAIPSGSVIDSAFLSVYADSLSPSGNSGYPTWGTDNAVGIYRLTAAWDTATVNWYDQPAYTATDSVILPQSTVTSQNYLRVNVSELVKDEYASGNHGFLFKELQETTPLNSMIFFSPYNYTIDSTVVPKLVIKYRNITGVSNVNSSNLTMEMYPNPGRSNVNIEVANNQGEGNIEVRDISGKMLFAQQISATHSIINLKVDNYASGIYFVSLHKADGSVLTKKLVVN